MTLNPRPNKAKCRLCGDIIQSFHNHDYVRCTCGEIAVDGGETIMRAIAADWKNFIRVDEEGNEIEITLKSEEVPTGQQGTQTEPQGAQASGQPHAYSKLENARILLKEMIKSYESLPQPAMSAMATNADVLSVLYLLSALERDGSSSG